MVRVKVFITSILLALLCSCSLSDKTDSAKDRLRQALAEDTISIAVLGGSISYGSGASRYENAWVIRLKEKLRKDWGKVIKIHNLGIGASDSEFGLYRYSHLKVLNPDLLIVEFAVNDHNMDSSLTIFNHEQLYRLAKQDSLAFLSVNLNKVDNQSQYESIKRVIDFYDLPSVRVKIDNDQLPDNVHPNDEGHLKIAEEVINYLDDFKKSNRKAKSNSITNYVLKDVFADLYLLENTKWSISDDGFYYLKGIAKNTMAYDTTRINFVGNGFGIAVMEREKSSEQNGKIAIQIDERNWKTFSLKSANDFQVVRSYTVAKGLENKRHQVKIVTLPDTLENGNITKQWEIVSLFGSK